MGSNILYALAEDAIVLNDRILSDFPDGDVGVLDMPNDLAEIKKGKDGKSIFAFKKSGLVSELTIRILKGSDDDLFLNTLLAAQNLNPHNFLLMTCRFVKAVAVSDNTHLSIGSPYTPKTAADTYLLTDGVFVKNPALRANTEGDVQTLITEYKMNFSNCIRTLGKN